VKISSHFAIIALAIFSFGLSFYENIYASFFIPTLFLLIIQRVCWKTFLKRVLILNIFVGIVVLSTLVNKEYSYAFLIFMRSNIILITTLILFNQRDIFHIAYGFSKLGLSKKLNALVFFMAKFVVLMKNELQSIKKAMIARNFKTKTDLFTYSIYANILGVLIVKSFDKAQKLHQAMELRGYNGTIYCSNYEKGTRMDLFFLGLTILCLLFPFCRIAL
jgi:cobalt/nickel transport system permease protein